MALSNTPRLVIAAPSSGSGKTTVTVAIARALKARGLRVALFKCGPDYLDPTYHARATGHPSHNLDGWMMGKEAVVRTFARATEGFDIALIEGVMGLFDGASPTGEEGSSAEIAKWLGAPVALVVDAGGMARSIAALVHGFATFDPDLRLAAVIANRVGSKGHLDLLKKAQREAPILGGFPKDEQNRFAERHLGLVTANDSGGAELPEAKLDHWGALAEEWVALDALVDLAKSALSLDAADIEDAADAAPSAPKCRIGLAYDDAFHFYYDDNLRRLEALGATLVRFSPIADAKLPDVDGLYLGGGYPEAHAEALTKNASMREAVAAFAAKGGPVYAECGGLMYLTRAIRTRDGVAHPMVGVFDAEAKMEGRLVALGYVEVETQERTLLGGAGLRFRGHQFRYSALDPAPENTPGGLAYTVRRRRGGEVTREGYKKHNVLASYVHAHWASNPVAAARFVESCLAHRREGRA